MTPTEITVRAVESYEIYVRTNRALARLEAMVEEARELVEQIARERS